MLLTNVVEKCWTPFRVYNTSHTYTIFISSFLSCLITVLTASISELANVEVKYLTMPGWKSKTAQVKSFSQFPQNAQAYVRKIEELIGVPSKFS